MNFPPHSRSIFSLDTCALHLHSRECRVYRVSPHTPQLDTYRNLGDDHRVRVRLLYDIESSRQTSSSGDDDGGEGFGRHTAQRVGGGGWDRSTYSPKELDYLACML